MAVSEIWYNDLLAYVQHEKTKGDQKGYYSLTTFTKAMQLLKSLEILGYSKDEQIKYLTELGAYPGNVPIGACKILKYVKGVDYQVGSLIFMG
jgi:hypothetical protein